jgi:hypothetical protein
MTFRRISNARPDDLAGSGVQAGQQESEGGAVVGSHDENSLLLKYSLLWISGSSVFGGKSSKHKGHDVHKVVKVGSVPVFSLGALCVLCVEKWFYR